MQDATRPLLRCTRGLLAVDAGLPVLGGCRRCRGCPAGPGPRSASPTANACSASSTSDRRVRSAKPPSGRRWARRRIRRDRSRPVAASNPPLRHGCRGRDHRAWRCARRGSSCQVYSVALVERDDYAVGTSSRSSKLIHGGLRYLQNFDLGLVREALLERALMVNLAPHLRAPAAAADSVVRREVPRPGHGRGAERLRRDGHRPHTAPKPAPPPRGVPVLRGVEPGAPPGRGRGPGAPPLPRSSRASRRPRTCSTTARPVRRAAVLTVLGEARALRHW